jgi:crotonobetainyl-CoA:carnitine CoA-transferase CaiB-like acyl-CoA transferase
MSDEPTHVSAGIAAAAATVASAAAAAAAKAAQSAASAVQAVAEATARATASASEAAAHVNSEATFNWRTEVIQRLTQIEANTEGLPDRVSKLEAHRSYLMGGLGVLGAGAAYLGHLILNLGNGK